MKRTLICAFTLLAFVACKPHEAEPSAEKKEGDKLVEESKVIRGENGEVILKLEDDDQERIGLKLAKLQIAEVSPEIKAYGRVLDGSALLPLVNEFSAAEQSQKLALREVESLVPLHAAELAALEAALKTSKQEFDRTQILAKQGNASTRALQLAEAAMQHDQLAIQTQKVTAVRARQTAEAAVLREQIAAQALNVKLLATWGKTIAANGHVSELAHALATQDTALVRVDVPAGEALPSAPVSARLATLSAPDKSFTAELLGPAPTTDAQTQGQGWLFLVRPNSALLTPGAVVMAQVQCAGEKVLGFLVPRTSVIRAEGKAWVYVEGEEEDTFTRKEIPTDHALPEGWFVSEGLRSKRQIVIAGAAQMLSEELKGKD